MTTGDACLIRQRCLCTCVCSLIYNLFTKADHTALVLESTTLLSSRQVEALPQWQFPYKHALNFDLQCLVYAYIAPALARGP